MRTVMVVAPHADDETLGCGGTMLRHRAEGDAVHWLLATDMSEESGYALDRIRARDAEIEEVGHRYGCAGVHRLAFPAAQLDRVPMVDLVAALSKVIKAVRPETIYVPNRGDAHTDHGAVFDAAVASTKWFRFPSVTEVAAYETLSETDFSLSPAETFRPNLYVSIDGYLEEKIAIMQVYEGEVAEFPFPRSETAIRAQAALRGAMAGCRAAEAFMLLRSVR